MGTLVFVTECSVSILTGQPVTLDDAIAQCGPPQNSLTSDSNGALSSSLPVANQLVSFVGTAISCSTPGSCAVTAAFYNPDAGGLLSFFGAPISFRPPTPATKDDCKVGGYRNFGDEDGRPFTNQGQCVSWVNHHS